MPVSAEPTVEEEKDPRGVVTRRVVRRPVLAVPRRIVYRKIILAPDGTEEGVEEKVEEPSEPQAVPVAPVDDEDVIAPMQVDDQENVPDTFGDEEFPEEPKEPEEKTETVTRRTVYRTAVLPADKPEDEEPKEKEPEEAVTIQDDGTVVRKVITVRKRIIRKIIVLPDGTRKEVEEEQPVEDEPTKEGDEPTEDEPTVDYVDVTRRTVHRVYVPGSAEERRNKIKPVEKVYETRVVRKPDGKEEVLDKSETIYPMEITPEEEEEPEEEETVEDVKDDQGVVVRRVVRRPVMVTNKITVVRRSELLPTGEEKDIEKSVEESPVTVEEPTKSKRVVLRRTTEPNGEETVIEQPEYISPLESSLTVESEPEVEEKKEKDQIVRTVRRRSVKTVQKRVVRRVVQPVPVEGRPTEEESPEPIEDTLEDLVEPTKVTIVRKTIVHEDGTTETVEEPQYEMPVSAEPTVEEEEKRPSWCGDQTCCQKTSAGSSTTNCLQKDHLGTRRYRRRRRREG
ncbi:probable serine/threonine-protein kinase kinX [Clytia hemisphaerica]|uniref:probable serine/threonine-protein kinase kinX n=1 Tax=Clytia hemisphaerica TaxID=252671 RepID=UPI0034D72032